MHDLSETDPSRLPFKLNICHDISFSNSFDRIIPKCLDVLEFIILPVRSEVVRLQLTCTVAAELAIHTSGLLIDLHVQTIGFLETVLMVLVV